MLRFVGKLLFVLVGLIAAAAAGLGGYRLWQQHESELALAITSSNSIDEGLFVPVGGGEQWITIRGTNRRHPVLLIVHGGPGAALSPLATAFLPFEHEWTVVQWDQPGAGKTFARAGDELPATTTLEGIAADGIAVTEFVKRRIGADRIVLLGVSWGSVVGLTMARARPDLFAAYVGTGLFVHRDDGRAIAYGRILARARAQQNTAAVAELEAIGSPPHNNPRDARTLNRWTDELTGAVEASTVSRLGELLLAPRQSLSDVSSYLRGFVASDEQFDLGSMDLRRDNATFTLPIVVIQGGEDYDTPVELAQTWFDSVAAPSKQFVRLPNGGHTALVYDPSFLAELNARVLPIVDSPTR
jgi:pimeloyl-ACP methyl ester carboxylesterase